MNFSYSCTEHRNLNLHSDNMNSEKLTTITQCIATLSPKNKVIVKRIFEITKKVEPKIKRVCRFNSIFFDLNGRLFYVAVQAKDRKKDTLTIWFCQWVHVSRAYPALELVLEGVNEWLAMIRKIKIDALQDLETYHFEELLEIIVAYNKEHNTHQEFVEKHRTKKKAKKA